MDRNTISSSSSGTFLCRQSSTRWIPTADQIRILRDLYYINGVRSPNGDQIQRITARLRHYGRVEGKNVFYWFQNHKARERQKKKLLLTGTTHIVDIHDVDNNNNNPNYGVATAQAAPASPGFYDGVGKPPATCGYGGGSMFRECSVIETSNYMPWMYPNIKEDDQDSALITQQEIQTLPLFPTNSKEEEEEEQAAELEDHHDFATTNMISTLHHSFTNSSTSNSGYLPSQNQQQQDYHYYYSNNSIGGAAASLELTLNSYSV